MKYIFIVNPTAGGGLKYEGLMNDLNKIKKEGKFDIEIVETTCPRDATNIAKALGASGIEACLISCGGDGTMQEVLNGMADYPNLSLGVYPSGSCNDFLKYFKDLDFADLNKLLTGHFMDVDTIKVEDNYSLNICNVGFDAKVNYDQIIFRQTLKNTKKAYSKAIRTNLGFKGLDLKIYLDDKLSFEGRALLAAFANSTTYGGGFIPTPKAKIDDGLIDVSIIKKINILRFALLFKKFTQGLMYENPKYEGKVGFSFRAKKIRVVSDEEFIVCIDGESIFSKDITLELIPKKIKLLVPNN